MCYDPEEIKNHRREGSPLLLLKLCSEIYYAQVIQSEARYCVFCRLELSHPTLGSRSLNEISHRLLCSSEGNRMER